MHRNQWWTPAASTRALACLNASVKEGCLYRTLTSFGETLTFLDRPYIVFAQALSDAMLLHVAKHAELEEIARDS
jgi:hypothetical protein